jgi:excisionase family DNA binding protein
MSKVDQQIIERLDRIEAKIENQRDEYLTFEEGADYLNFSPSYLYKLTHQNKIPFYRPNGKKIRFKRSELNAWIEAKRVPAINELQERAIQDLGRRQDRD